jgi:Protein of unknown function (DUF3106)
MPSFLQLRHLVRLAFAGMLLSSTTTILLAQSAYAHRSGAALRAPISQARPVPGPGPTPGSSPGPERNQEHLAQWMERHSNLSPADQQHALENEPGFRDLPATTQQRMRDRLTQLNNMSPEQRRRILDRTEAMERLTPPQRQQVRGAMLQLGGLPQDRRRLVARAFRDLREMPQPQRQAILNSDRFRGQFSDQERSTLSSLLAVEPYLPVRRPDDGPSYGK